MTGARRTQRRRARRRGYDWHDDHAPTAQELLEQLLAAGTDRALDRMLWPDEPETSRLRDAADEQIAVERFGGQHYPSPFARRR